MFTLLRLIFRLIYKLIKLMSFLLSLIIIISLLINAWIMLTTANDLTTLEKAHEEKTYALVLGASISPDKTPSPILKERLDGAIKLHQKGLVKKLILSGGSHPDYNEVESMYQYALNHGIAAKDLIKDNNGISTEYSINNYFNTYETSSLYIVTQKYHLYRSVYLAKDKDIKVTGLISDQKKWGNADHHIEREFFSRINAFINVNFPNLPRPLITLGEKIKASLDGYF